MRFDYRMLAAMMLTASAQAEAEGRRPRIPRKAASDAPPKNDEQPRGLRIPLDVACPTCGAAPQVACKRSTLGRHTYHWMRMETLRCLQNREG